MMMMMMMMTMMMTTGEAFIPFLGAVECLGVTLDADLVFFFIGLFHLKPDLALVDKP